MIVEYKNYQELSALSSKANKFSNEEQLPRNKFAVDRDRILYSKEFRRLSGKTQVFVVGFDDHQRTRLTHTLEVTLIAKTISNILGFNDVLTEAISYGHDVGHTPFGHVGERTLNFIMNNCEKFRDHYEISAENSGFKHNWQGIRVVCELEKISDDFSGLNLTDFTLWGILYHSSVEYKSCKYSKNEKKQCNLMQSNNLCRNVRAVKVEGNGGTKDDGAQLKLEFYNKYKQLIPDEAWTFEALVVKIADEIAQRHHDTEDSLLANLFTPEELLNEFENCFSAYIVDEFDLRFKDLKLHQKSNLFISKFTSFVIDFLIQNLVVKSQVNIEKFSEKFEIVDSEDFYAKKDMITKTLGLKELFNIINYENEFSKCEERYQDIIWKRILLSQLAQSMDAKSKFVIRKLFKAFISNPQQLPNTTIRHLFNKLNKYRERTEYQSESIGELRKALDIIHYGKEDKLYINVLHRTICDFIAGATDNYALSLYEILYGTKQVFKNNGT